MMEKGKKQTRLRCYEEKQAALASHTLILSRAVLTYTP